MIVAVKPTKSGKRQWKVVPRTEEDKKERKRRLHREEMVQFRLRKKLNESTLRSQHAQLELVMRNRVFQWKLEAAKSSDAMTSTTSELGVDDTAELRDRLGQLILQSEELRTENERLREVVASHGALQRVIYSERCRLGQEEAGESVLGGGGWRVTFPDGEPSFCFYPFLKDEAVGVVQRYDEVMKVTSCAEFQEVGMLLGWRVERLQLVRHDNDKWMVTRVRFTKRIHCADGELDATMDKLAAQSWKVATTPALWSRVHRADVTTLKLQELDEDTVVLVSNSPQRSRGGHLRYLTMMHRRNTVDEHGKRSISYAMVIPDSKANKRSREADDCRDNLQWVCEGAAYMTLTQIDETTLEVTYDNCSGCKNEIQTQYLLVEWGHEAIRWEQLVTPSKLLVN